MGASDSKYLFRHRVNQLLTRPISADDHEFWKLLFISQLSTEEVFSLVQPSDVRRLRRKQPRNLSLLIFKSIEQVYLFNSQETQDFTSAANSIRILSRIMPFVFENGRFDNKEIIDDLPGSCHIPAGLDDDEMDLGPAKASEPLPEGYDFVVNFFWKNTAMDADGKEKKFTAIGGKPLDQPLGQMLMDLLLHCCFYPGFTRPANKKVAMPTPPLPDYRHLMPLRLWCGGIAQPDSQLPASTAAMDVHRVDVLRCILACCTQPVFEKDALYPSKFLRCLTEAVGPPAVTLCYSLLNVIASYNPRGSLPYTSYLGVSRETLLEASLHVLLILLDYRYLSRVHRSPDNPADAKESCNTHAFWFVCRHLSKEEDLLFLFNGLTQLLSNHLDAANTYLPRSQRQINCHSELLLLLFKLIDVNPQFLAKMCKKFDICKLLIALVWYLHECQEEHSRFGTLQIATFIILTFSCERDFGVNLNTPLARAPPMPLPAFTGNHIDLLYLTIYQLITSSKAWLTPLHDCWLTIICNISPYAKSLSTMTATKLVQLFETYSAPRRLQDGNPQVIGNVTLLLDTFNNLIQYQYEGNCSLALVITRREEAFSRLEKICSNTDNPELPKLPEQAKEAIHIGTIMRMLAALKPELQAFQADHQESTEAELLAFLQKITLVGLLPVPHPIMIRRFEKQHQTYYWLTSWAWSIVCQRTTNPPMLDVSTVQLFRTRVVDKGSKPAPPPPPADTATPSSSNAAPTS